VLVPMLLRFQDWLDWTYPAARPAVHRPLPKAVHRLSMAIEAEVWRCQNLCE
jgi:hypothetical protein